MLNATTIVRKAISNTRNTDPAHWLRCLEDRAGTEAHLGSYFPRRTPEQIDDMLERLQWEPYTHSEVKEPAQAFIARSISGMFGMVQLSDVPNDADLEWVQSKEEDRVECVWRNHGTKGIEVDFVVLLVGPGDHGDIVWTFHPGDPVRPSTAPRWFGGDNSKSSRSSDQWKKTSKAGAASHGIKWVKLG